MFKDPFISGRKHEFISVSDPSPLWIHLYLPNKGEQQGHFSFALSVTRVNTFVHHSAADARLTHWLISEAKVRTDEFHLN